MFLPLAVQECGVQPRPTRVPPDLRGQREFFNGILTDNSLSAGSRNIQLQDAYDYTELARNGVGIGVGDCDMLRGVLSCNTVTVGLFGLSGPMVGTPYADWAQMLAPDVLQRVEAESMPILKDPTQHDVRLQYPIVLKDGRRRDLQWVCRMFRDKEGRATRMLGCDSDVTAEVES
jgi:PAS domain-containing protein